MRRQMRDETRTAIGRGTQLQHPAVLAHDVERDREPESGAALGALGGEEGIEDAMTQRYGHARAVVAHADFDDVAGQPRRHFDATGGSFGERMLGVHQQIQEYLFEARSGAVHEGQVGFEQGLDEHTAMVV